jgi:hypothetical protein
MGIQEEISKYLQTGYTPQQIINIGYKKSTVYKVYDTFKTYATQIGKPDWTITDIRYNNQNKRYLPRENISISFNFENTSGRDMYINKIGVWVEWLKPDVWIAQDVKDLVKSGQRRLFSFIISVPNDILFGEYELRFGIEAQYLPVIGYQDQLLQTQWTDPEIIHIKNPLTGIKVFISHSTQDMPLVRQLANHLDNYGLYPIIAEDLITPGAVLKDKFQTEIREANIFLVLFTENSINSTWVVEETNYALQIGKPTIPLKEESVRIDNSIEWIEFSKYERPEIIFSKIMNGVNSRLYNQQISNNIPISPQNNAATAIIGIGILAFLAGLFMGSAENK